MDARRLVVGVGVGDRAAVEGEKVVQRHLKQARRRRREDVRLLPEVVELDAARRARLGRRVRAGAAVLRAPEKVNRVSRVHGPPRARRGRRRTSSALYLPHAVMQPTTLPLSFFFCRSSGHEERRSYGLRRGRAGSGAAQRRGLGERDAPVAERALLRRRRDGQRDRESVDVRGVVCEAASKVSLETDPAAAGRRRRRRTVVDGGLQVKLAQRDRRNAGACGRNSSGPAESGTRG